MKSVMIFEPKDSDKQTMVKLDNWYKHNKSAVFDKYIPNAAETRKMLHG